MDCTELLFKGVMKCTCPWDPPPLPPPKKKKKTAIVCLNKTEAKSLSLVGRLEAKFWIFFSCFVYRWLYVVGINRVIQLFKITLFPPPPQLPKTPCEDPTFLCLVLLVMSSVSQTIWHLLAQGANGLRWSMEFRYYVLGLRCVKYQNLFSYSRNRCFQNSEQKGFEMTWIFCWNHSNFISKGKMSFGYVTEKFGTYSQRGL